MKIDTKHLAFFGLLLAAAVLIGYVEAVIPVDLMVPGVKLGLANCAILFILYRFGYFDALLISLLRTLIIALLFLSPAMLIYSLSGAAVSLTVMAVLKKMKCFSVYGVSAAGGMSHNITQLLIASVVMINAGAGVRRIVLFYLPVLILTGIAAGMFNAFISDILIKRIPRVEFIASGDQRRK